MIETPPGWNDDSDSTFQVLLYKWNVNLQKATTTTNVAENRQKQFDSEVVGDVLYRLSYASEPDPGKWWFESYALPTLLSSSVEFPLLPSGEPIIRIPSLVNENGTLRIFAIGAEGLYTCTYQSGGSFSAWVQIVEDSRIFRVAGSVGSTTRCHFIRKKDEKRLYHFSTAEWNGTEWEIIDSDTYWQYSVRSLGATPLPDDNTADVLVFEAQRPGLVSLSNEGTKIIKTMDPAGGLMSFVYRDGILSDHYNVDVLDKLTETNKRQHVRVTTINNEIYVTAWSVSGGVGVVSQYPVSFYRVYTSVNGKHWSMGVGLKVDSEVGEADRGIDIHQHGSKLYAVQAADIYMDDSTLQFGHPATSTWIDVTHDIEQLSYQQQDGAQIKIVLSNADRRFDGHPLINDTNTLAGRLRIGHWNGVSPVLIDVMLFEVDSLSFNYEPGRYAVEIDGRDRFAWMSDLSTSEHSKYWTSQLVATDAFLDDPRSATGGMAHVAIQTGSWVAKKGKLKMISAATEVDPEGDISTEDRGIYIAFSTFDPYIWNGAHEAEFRLDTPGNDEMAGLIFRAQDHDNFWAWYYMQTGNKFRLSVWTGGHESVIREAAAPLNWDDGDENDATRSWKWLRIEFKYARITPLYSNDGIEWFRPTLKRPGYPEDNYNYFQADGAPEKTDALMLDMGYVGWLAKGNVAEDEIPPEDGDIPPIIWTPDPDEDGYPEPEIPLPSGDADYALVVTTGGSVYWTSQFNIENPLWNKLGGWTSIVDADFDRSSSGVSVWLLQATSGVPSVKAIYVPDIINQPTVNDESKSHSLPNDQYHVNRPKLSTSLYDPDYIGFNTWRYDYQYSWHVHSAHSVNAGASWVEGAVHNFEHSGESPTWVRNVQVGVSGDVGLGPKVGSSVNQGWGLFVNGVRDEGDTSPKFNYARTVPLISWKDRSSVYVAGDQGVSGATSWNLYQVEIVNTDRNWTLLKNNVPMWAPVLHTASSYNSIALLTENGPSKQISYSLTGGTTWTNVGVDAHANWVYVSPAGGVYYYGYFGVLRQIFPYTGNKIGEPLESASIQVLRCR